MCSSTTGLYNQKIMSSLEPIGISMDTRRDSLVIIPMYNEKENAAAIIEAVLALPHPFDVLVIDDIEMTIHPTGLPR